MFRTTVETVVWLELRINKDSEGMKTCEASIGLRSLLPV